MGVFDLVLFIVRTALAIIEAQILGRPLPVADSLVNIIQAGYAAYEKQTGQPLDPATIKPFELIP